MYALRRAERGDARAIRRLIYSERLNPLGLDWRRFWLAVDGNGDMIGCGQVKTHRDGSRELASIAVRAEWRRRGVASALIRQLLAEHPPPLYLTCRAELVGFYARFGFAIAENPSQLPAYFRRIAQISRRLRRMTHRKLNVQILVLPKIKFESETLETCH